MLILIAGLAAAVLLVVIVMMRRGGADRRGDLLAPPARLGGKSSPPRLEHPTQPPRRWPEGAAPIAPLADQVDAEVRRLMAQDRKIEAIKLVRAATHWDLRTSKEWVERL